MTDIVRGLDVSAYQGQVDWSKLNPADQIRFVICKCAEFSVDPTFVHNVTGARAQNLIVGAYFLVHPELGDPRATAEKHWKLNDKNIGANPGELPPMIDWEVPWPPSVACPPVLSRSWVLAYADRLEELAGCVPLLYSFPAFLKWAQPETQADFAHYRLAYADYDHPGGWPMPDAQSPVAPLPWGGKPTIWQDTGGSFYRLPNGACCDTDVFLGTEAELSAFCAGSRI